MLRAGFLGTLSEWVARALDARPEDLDQALGEFGMETLLTQEADEEKRGALFTEWVVFDHRSRAFGGTTGLAYFCSGNPLGLPERDMTAYRELLDFKVGYFEVVASRLGECVTLRDMEGAEYGVADISASMTLLPGETVWTRIAQVGGVYHMVGSQGVRPPFTYSSGMKKVILGWGTNAVDARHAASMLYGGASADKGGQADEKPMQEAEAAKAFDDALKAAGMHEMISSATVKKWANNERKFPPGFPMKTVYFLMPEDLNERQRDKVLAALQTYLANLPRRKLKGRTPLQASAEQKSEERHLDMDMYSYEDYADDVHGANDLMPRDSQKAYIAYERLIRRLLDEKVPLITAFRIFANAGLCLLMQDETGTDPLGFELIRASLRLNPLYDFGLRQKERCIDPMEDFSSVPKKDRALLKGVYAIMQQDGERRYRRSAFRRYEDFLKQSGISLQYKTNTTPTVFHHLNGTSIRVGRNEPCPCGSGKKFKKCCGS